MLKAKAKAAATAAAQKRKAQEAATQQAAQSAAFGPGTSTTRSGRGLRPNVTQYWADSAANVLAPGGSIQRIGYDQAVYEEAVRTLIFDEPMPEERKGAVGLIPAADGAAGQDAKEDGGEKAEKGAETGAADEAKDNYKTNKDDLAIVLDNFDLSSAAASQALRQHKGDLAATLTDLCGPRSVPASSPAIRA
ncbi:hypothetical protein JCM8202v2_001678 [Rhodotorula sphaerocarpa]